MPFQKSFSNEDPEHSRHLNATGKQAMMPPAFQLKAESALPSPTIQMQKDEEEDEGWGWMDWVHAGLDVAGMIPVIGEVADLANAAIYTAEGDYGNAALSAASAIPFLGWGATAAKWGKRGIDALQIADKANDTRKVVDKAAGAGKALPNSKGIKNGEKANAGKPKPYSKSRPPHKEETIENVWESAKQKNGKVYDPNTGQEITWDKTRKRNGQWDMGHVPEQEYRKLHKKYMDGEIDKETFLKEFHDPENYLPELPSPNRSRKYEAK